MIFIYLYRQVYILSSKRGQETTHLPASPTPAAQPLAPPFEDAHLPKRFFVENGRPGGSQLHALSSR
eukprot:s433_g10.t1